MTTELVILLLLATFILTGFLGGDGPFKSAFINSGPVLATRIERQLDTGSLFQTKAKNHTGEGDGLGWSKPTKGDFD